MPSGGQYAFSISTTVLTFPAEKKAKTSLTNSSRICAKITLFMRDPSFLVFCRRNSTKGGALLFVLPFFLQIFYAVRENASKEQFNEVVDKYFSKSIVMALLKYYLTEESCIITCEGVI